ncbi:pyridoxamine 5'-phosphate oxidase family protein [Amycolatopsis sp. NPDC059021]|uniref:pyridoxamine 5'-phosphate oxidase family protein n=1 Tax=Amycolatopsis sp. NPDC059021 TaxID=3346704 RepID=UPI00366EACAE
MDLSMTEREQQEFLAGKHIGVLAVQRRSGPPLAVPMWYGYRPGGDVVLWTDGEDTLKGRLIRKTGAFTLVVQNEDPPYRYVSVSGPVTAWEEATVEAAFPVAARYLPEQQAREFVEAFNPGHVIIRMTPDRWRSIDYGKTSNVLTDRDGTHLQEHVRLAQRGRGRGPAADG